MAFPYAIADESGLLLWMNDGFADIVRDDRKNKTLFGLFPELTREILNGIDGREVFTLPMETASTGWSSATSAQARTGN